jgi:hypothetical protein
MAVIGLAGLGVAAIAFATLCPIGLRPHLADPDSERFGAYLVLGALISLAAGRRGLSATALVLALAFGLEASQLLVPGRDAAMPDAMVKAFGGLCGVVPVQLMHPLRRLIVRLSGLSHRRWDTVFMSATSH